MFFIVLLMLISACGSRHDYSYIDEYSSDPSPTEQEEEAPPPPPPAPTYNAPTKAEHLCTTVNQLIEAYPRIGSLAGDTIKTGFLSTIYAPTCNTEYFTYAEVADFIGFYFKGTVGEGLTWNEAFKAYEQMKSDLLQCTILAQYKMTEKNMIQDGHDKITLQFRIEPFSYLTVYLAYDNSPEGFELYLMLSD